MSVTTYRVKKTKDTEISSKCDVESLASYGISSNRVPGLLLDKCLCNEAYLLFKKATIERMYVVPRGWDFYID